MAVCELLVWLLTKANVAVVEHKSAGNGLIEYCLRPVSGQVLPKMASCRSKGCIGVGYDKSRSNWFISK